MIDCAILHHAYFVFLKVLILILTPVYFLPSLLLCYIPTLLIFDMIVTPLTL